jgi:hypothetical protein
LHLFAFHWLRRISLPDVAARIFTSFLHLALLISQGKEARKMPVPRGLTLNPQERFSIQSPAPTMISATDISWT